MFGVDGRADVILETFMKEERDGSSSFGIDPDGPDARFYAQLKDAGFIDAIGSWGCEVIVVKGLTLTGREHVQKVRQSKLASGFPILSLDDDALLRECYERYENDDNVNDREMCEDNADALSRLHRQGLIDVDYADNRPYVVKGITEKGIRYAQDLIPEADSMSININPVFSNSNSVSSEANAIAYVFSSITVSGAMRAIEECSLNEPDKQNARTALYELEEASASKDESKFLDALEKIAKITKNAADLGNAIIPLVAKLATVFIQ